MARTVDHDAVIAAMGDNDSVANSRSFLRGRDAFLCRIKISVKFITVFFFAVLIRDHLEGVVCGIDPFVIIGIEVFMLAAIMHEFQISRVDVFHLPALMHDIIRRPDRIIGRLLLVFVFVRIVHPYMAPLLPPAYRRYAGRKLIRGQDAHGH